MAQRVPLSNNARQTFRCTLGGQLVRVWAWWQPLSEAWFISLALVSGDRIIAGVRLGEGARPLRGSVLPGFAGELYVEGVGEPTRNAWGVTHRLLWVTSAEAAVLP